jgi:hypothetical protein
MPRKNPATVGRLQVKGSGYHTSSRNSKTITQNHGKTRTAKRQKAFARGKGTVPPFYSKPNEPDNVDGVGTVRHGPATA